MLDVKYRVLYAGDTIQKNNIYMFWKHRSPESFETSLDKLIGMRDQYDYIYSSHGDYLLPGDYAIKIKDAWKQVQSGDVPFEVIDLHGNKVKLYSAGGCGFFM